MLGRHIFGMFVSATATNTALGFAVTLWEKVKKVKQSRPGKLTKRYKGSIRKNKIEKLMPSYIIEKDGSKGDISEYIIIKGSKHINVTSKEFYNF